MQCEICGSQSATRKIAMDGNELIVCNNCVGYGKEIRERELPVKQKKQIFSPEPLPEVDELIAEYGKIVRQARERKGLTIKELAEKVFEKELVLHKIEQQKMQPDDKLIGKLQKLLGIELLKRKEE